jgi:hypothetical protein
VRKALRREIKESDWKILRRLHAQALERFCQQILLEVERINADHTRSFHQKYLALYEFVQRRDRELAQTFDDLRRSTAFIQLAAMQSRGLVSEEEFAQFSQETQQVVALLVGD